MIKNKIVILGAGLSGLSAAWHLKQRGIKSVVFEKEKEVGGLCRSKKIKNFIFDYDGHLLHFRDNYTLNLVKTLLKNNLVCHNRSAWINNFGIFSRYPFQANLYALPKSIASECLWGFIYAYSSKTEKTKQDFLNWVNLTFGKGIARHFMIPYNQKFWRFPLDQMVCPWVDKFIPQPGLSDVVNGFFDDKNNPLGYNANFWYPARGGIGQLAKAFEKQIGDISKNCQINEIDLKRKEITVNQNQKHKFDILILTLPLPELIKIIKPLPLPILNSLKKLRWNSIYNLNLGIDTNCHAEKHWVYFPHKKTVFFRCGFFHNFSNRVVPQGKSSLYTEISYSKNQLINKRKITQQVIRDLKKVGILNKKNKILAIDINDIKYAYPIYDRNYLQATKAVQKFLLKNNIITCGRYGSWQYMSMEDAILDGKRVAEELKR